MAFISQKIEDLVTDQLKPFTAAELTKLRDNIENGHDHTTGKGIQIPIGGIADLALTGAKAANGAITSDRLSPEVGVASELGANFLPTADTTDQVDSSLAVTVNPNVASIALCFYLVNVIGAISTAVVWTVKFQVNGSDQTEYQYQFKKDDAGDRGNLFYGRFAIAAGSRTIRPVWISDIVGGDAFGFAPRFMTVLVIGQ